MMLVFGFGYAKPVPVNPRNFKHYKLGLCLVSIAGPLSNALLSLLGTVLLYITAQINSDMMRNFFMGISTSFETVWIVFITTFIITNASLAVFNLLPIPPLDGSRIITAVLPAKLAYYYNKYESYIMLAVFALLYLNVLDGAIYFLRDGLLSCIEWLTELIPFSDLTKQYINF